MCTTDSVALCSIVTSPPGRSLAMSTSVRPGSTTAPSPFHTCRHCRAQRELHVGRRQAQILSARLEQDPRQDLNRGARRDSTPHDRKALNEVFLCARDPQPGTNCNVAFNHLKILVAVIGSVDGGEDVPAAASFLRAACGGSLWTIPLVPQAGNRQRTCFTRAVSSCTRLYTDLSSLMRREIFEVAWITVVWSRPPNSLPILGRDESVSSRERYIATCLG